MSQVIIKKDNENYITEAVSAWQFDRHEKLLHKQKHLFKELLHPTLQLRIENQVHNTNVKKQKYFKKVKENGRKTSYCKEASWNG